MNTERWIGWVGPLSAFGRRGELTRSSTTSRSQVGPAGDVGSAAGNRVGDSVASGSVGFRLLKRSIDRFGWSGHAAGERDHGVTLDTV